MAVRRYTRPTLRKITSGHLRNLSKGGLRPCERPLSAWGRQSASVRPPNCGCGLPSRCKDNGIVLSDPMLAAVEEGFDGDDQFDAAMGLLGMIEVVEGRRPESSPAMQHPEWEGWI